MDKKEPLYGTLSRCHNSPSLIVQSRDGGFVTQNCILCGIPRAVHLDELPDLKCSKCNSKLNKGKSILGNYEYRCSQSDNRFLVHAVIPHWSERFEYHGYALDSDYISDYSLKPYAEDIDIEKIKRELNK